MTEPTRRSRATEAFYGRRRGKSSRRPGRCAGPAIAGSEAGSFKPPHLLVFEVLWPGPVDEVRLEIGFGGGEHLLHRARTAPRTGFIGVEPFVNSMAKMLASLEADGLLPTSVFMMMTPRRFSIGCPIPWSIGLIFSIPIPGPR
jgi:tRNA (guanine-N7-)-methyltransferase